LSLKYRREGRYILQTGQVNLVYQDIETGEDGHDFVQTGEFLGVKSTLGRYPREENAIALQDTTVMAFTVPEFESLVMSNTRIIMQMLKLFVRRIYDSKRRFMILTLEDDQAKIADVFLMLAETQPVTNKDRERRVFKTSVDDIARWAGISPALGRNILNHFAVQRRLEIYPDRIIVKNISDFARFVNSRRKKR
jgi:CRP-like cAMP-binding protein